MKFQKFFFLLFLTLILFSQYGFTPIELTVGKEPTFIYGYYDIQVHDFKLLVVTSGFDSNFNGVKDPGDENPAIYSISYQSFSQGNMNGTKLADLPFVMLPFPLRPGIAPTRNSIFLPIGNIIQEYNFTDGSTGVAFPAFDTTASFTAYTISGVYYDSVINYSFISLRTYGAGQDRINVIDHTDYSIVDSIFVPANPQQILVFEDKLYILCEGTFGSNDSKLISVELSTIGTNNHQIQTLDLGDGANHLTTVTSGDKKYIVATMTAAGEIHFINPTTFSTDLSSKVPASGYDGPRETIVFGGEIPYITAYNGNLYVQRTLNQLDSIPFGAKLESIFGYKSPNPLINFEILALTSPFKMDYSPNDKVYVLLNFSGVQEKILHTENFKLYPNPASDLVILKVGEPVQSPVEVEFLDLFGSKVAQYHFNLIGSEVALPVTNLTQGTYFARINGKATSKTIPFAIVR